MNYFKLLFCTTSLLLLFSPAFVHGEDFSDFAELDLEALLNTTVITASKREQKLSEAPNAIYVITAEDIKHSGAVDVPDLLRMVPGIDVVNVYGNSYGVSGRGFNERFAQRMLFVIDGRSIYTTFFGGVFWENEQLFLEDIARVEVIRGPGATLWGANAVNGVVNIITKDPEEDQGGLITGKAGSKNYRENVTSYSDTLADKLHFRVTGGYREDEGTRGTNDFRRVSKATHRSKYEFSDNSDIHFFAGFNESKMGLELSKYTPRTDANVRSNYEMLQWEYRFSDTSQLQIKGYHDYYEVHSHDREVDIEEEKYDVSIEHSFRLGEKHHFLWGLNYRTTEADSGYLSPETDHDDLIGFFLQDEIQLSDKLRLITGIKYEENSFTGGDWSPRGCLLYSPWVDHHFRFSVSKAFRTPSFVEDSFRVVQTLPSPLPPIPLAVVVGNDHLDPEDMTAFELGYRTTLFKKVGLNLELYYNDFDKVIENVILRKTLPLLISWENDFHVIAKGIEFTADYPVTHWWSLTANYTFQEVEYKRVNRDVPGTPKHKFNLWSSFRFKNGFSLDLIAHYVDDTKWSGLTGDVKVDDYWRYDIRIAQKLFNDKLELSFSGQNLTDKLHPETSDGTGTYEVERLLYGQITFRF
jgi:iron complex outermembrane receptor protein